MQEWGATGEETAFGAPRDCFTNTLSGDIHSRCRISAYSLHFLEGVGAGAGKCGCCTL